MHTKKGIGGAPTNYRRRRRPEIVGGEALGWLENWTVSALNV